jgi:hypothetical protein
MADDDARAAAKQRLEDKRGFYGNLVSYLVVNAVLVVIWAVSDSGSFWPIWVIGGWGIGLALHGWDVFFRRPITEADIQREMKRQQGTS